MALPEWLVKQDSLGHQVWLEPQGLMDQLEVLGSLGQLVELGLQVALGPLVRRDRLEDRE